jgi:hypothetical protein
MLPTQALSKAIVECIAWMADSGPELYSPGGMVRSHATVNHDVH